MRPRVSDERPPMRPLTALFVEIWFHDRSYGWTPRSMAVDRLGREPDERDLAEARRVLAERRRAP